MLDQDTVFLTSEGNAYYARNKDALTRWDPELDIPLRLLHLYGLQPHKAIEIGAANGARLNALYERHGTHVTAVEPSLEAIVDGSQCWPHIGYFQGTASAIPVSGRFDLVVVNFVLHWVDRHSLLRSVAEIDRVLEDGGYLLLGDFAPSAQHKVAYHHKPGLWTYKQDYAAIFLASGLYKPIGMLASGHKNGELTADADDGERTACWLLRKQV